MKLLLLDMPAIFLLTLDTEIAWGVLNPKGFVKYKKHFDNYRINFDQLTNLLSKYQIKATWAIVGHLFLDHCGRRHPDVLTPQYKWYKKDWYERDPGTDITKDPWWYGKDIIEKIKRMGPEQEIGTHTFSHVIIGDAGCSRAVAFSEFKKCIELAGQENISLDSVVFPRNKIGHLDVLKELGFKCFRGKTKTWYRKWPEISQKIIRNLEFLIPLKPPPVYKIQGLKKYNDVLEIPASLFLMPYDGVKKILPAQNRFKLVKRGLDQAIKKEAIFHLWFHPLNLGSSEKMFENLEDILKTIRQLIDQNELINLTMRELAERYEQSKS